MNNLVFVGMKIPFHNPFCTVSAIHLDGVRSICSFIKCPLVITSRRFFVLKAPTSMVYNEIQAAYVGLGIMGFYCIKCLPNTIIVSATVSLAFCVICTCVCMCEHTIRLTQSWRYE